MKINEVVQEGWGRALGLAAKDVLGAHNVDADIDRLKGAGATLANWGSKLKRRSKTGTPAPTKPVQTAPAQQPTQTTPATTTPAQPATAQPAATQQAQPVPAPEPTPDMAVPAKKTAAPTTTQKPYVPPKPRTPTKDQSLMVQQMRGQAGLPVRKGIPATTPTKQPSTMVQQMQAQAAQQASAKAKAPLLKRTPNIYGRPQTTVIPTAASKSLPISKQQPYRSSAPVHEEGLEESIDLAEVLWQKMKRS